METWCFIYSFLSSYYHIVFAIIIIIIIIVTQRMKIVHKLNRIENQHSVSIYNEDLPSEGFDKFYRLFPAQ